MQTKLASMLNRIELEIQSVEKRIGDKMHVLDRDKDGMVSAEEIAYVVQHVLSTTITEEEAKAIAKAVRIASILCFGNKRRNTYSRKNGTGDCIGREISAS